MIENIYRGKNMKVYKCSFCKKELNEDEVEIITIEAALDDKEHSEQSFFECPACKAENIV